MTRYKSNGPSSDSAQRLRTAQTSDKDIVTANDEALALALQQEEIGSDEEEADPALARALALSRLEQEQGTTNETESVLEWGLNEEPQQEAELVDVDVPIKGEDSDELEEVSLVPSGRTTPQDLSLPETRAEETDMEIASPAVTDQLPSSPLFAPEAQEALQSVDEALEGVKEETKAIAKKSSIPTAPPPTAIPPLKTPQPAQDRVPRHPVPSRSVVSISSRDKAPAVPANVNGGSVTNNAIAGSSRPSSINLTSNGLPPVTRTPSADRPLMTSTGVRAREALSRQNRDESPDLDHDDDLPDEVRMPASEDGRPVLGFRCSR